MSSIRGRGSSTNLRDRVIFGRVCPSITGISKTGTNMGRALSCFITEIGTKGCTPMENLKGRAPMSGTTGRFIRDSSKMGWGSGMEFGSTDRRSMKDRISTIRETAKECTSGRAAVTTKDRLSRIWDTDTGRCTGRTTRFTGESGARVRNTGRGRSGRREKLYKRGIFKTVNSKIIRKKISKECRTIVREGLRLWMLTRKKCTVTEILSNCRLFFQNKGSTLFTLAMSTINRTTRRKKIKIKCFTRVSTTSKIRPYSNADDK